jgi:tRNA splicing ligase
LELQNISYITVDPSGKAHLPCNIDTIDAVTTQEMGRKAYATRVDFEMDGILNTDTIILWKVMTSLGRGVLTCRCCRQRIHLTSWKENISVGKQYAGHKIALAFTGLPRI